MFSRVRMGGCPWLTTLDKIKININNMGVCPWSVQPLTLGPVAPDPPFAQKKESTLFEKYPRLPI